jgi:predicted permease
MGIPIVRGRDFTAADQERASHLTIISESMARAHFPGQDPIGRRVAYGPRQAEPDWHEIVGIAGDVRHGDLEEAPAPRAYDLYGQHNSLALFLVIRTAQEPALVTASVRTVVRELDPDAPVYSIATMEDLRGRAVSPRKYVSLLVACFAALAVFLALIGIHGVLAYNVERRTRELGVRLALGAQRSDVLGLVIREGLAIAIGGLVVGLAGALALSRFLESLLYGVEPTDAGLYAAVALAVVLVSLAACLVPARRAMRVDPLATLRAE